MNKIIDHGPLRTGVHTSNRSHSQELKKHLNQFQLRVIIIKVSILLVSVPIVTYNYWNFRCK